MSQDLPGAAGGGLDVGRVSFDFTLVPFGETGQFYRYALHIKFGPLRPTMMKPGHHKVMQKAEESEPPLNFFSN